MMRSFVLAANGRDRPGIVAAVTGVLLDHGLNIEDAEMAILRGHFAVMLVVTGEDGVDEPALREALERLRAGIPLESISLTEVPGLDTGPAEATHSISVYGADHPGIVHGVAAVLAEEQVNVVGLSTRTTGGLYVMLLDVTLPPSLDERGLEQRLREVAQDQGVDVSLRTATSDPL
jgi:glycine cleavage system transcriptional repressor